MRFFFTHSSNHPFHFRPLPPNLLIKPKKLILQNNQQNRFGPKNAPASQTQYLYLFNEDGPARATEEGTAALASAVPLRGCVLLVTQFDGIPMADVFKVMHYWSFEREVAGAGAGRTKVRIGVAVHFIKSSMLKGQISSGVRDELVGLSQKWCLFAEARVVHGNIALGTGSTSEVAGAAAANNSNNNIGNGNGRRPSLRELADAAGTAAEAAAGGAGAGSEEADAASVMTPQGASAKARAVSAAIHAATETQMMIVLVVLALLLVGQFVYNRMLVGRLDASAAALEALRAEVAKQARAHASLVALVEGSG